MVRFVRSMMLQVHELCEHIAFAFDYRLLLSVVFFDVEFGGRVTGQKLSQQGCFGGVFDLASVLRVGPSFHRFQFSDSVCGPDEPEFFSPLLCVENETVSAFGDLNLLTGCELRRIVVAGCRRKQHIETRMSRGFR